MARTFLFFHFIIQNKFYYSKKNLDEMKKKYIYVQVQCYPVTIATIEVIFNNLRINQEFVLYKKL